MRRIHGTLWAVIACLGLVVGCGSERGSDEPAEQSQAAAAGFSLSGGKIYSACDPQKKTPFVMRGINYPYTWFAKDRGDTTVANDFANMKSAGANTVRVVVSGGDFQEWDSKTSSFKQWDKTDTTSLRKIIGLCKTSKLICMLNYQDTVGYLDNGDNKSATLVQAVTYWQSVKSALDGSEAFVIINIGNEPYGNTTPENWTAATKTAIKDMRAAKFEHMLIVDAPNWGQDWKFIMRDNAASVFAEDTKGLTVFRIHMYGVFDTAKEITDYYTAFSNLSLPLVVGEFADQHTDGNPDEATIMAEAQSRGIGYIGWSWSGNSSPLDVIDMTNSFNASSLTTWGVRIVNGADGLKVTSNKEPSGSVTFTTKPADGLFDGTCSGGSSTGP